MHYLADLVLNQNISANESLYSFREPYTRLLLGPRYALLRKEFWPWREWTRHVPKTASKILVTLGGSDKSNTTLTVINAIKQLSTLDLEIKVVVGPSNPNILTLRNAIENAAGKFHLLENVSDMAEIMAWADCAVTAGGSTCWELIFFQLPFISIVTAENQRQSVDILKKLDLTKTFSFLSSRSYNELTSEIGDVLSDWELRKKWSQKLSSIVDGKGADRVCSLL